MIPNLHLAQLLCARLCHDLGGAVGSLAGTLELAESGDAEMLALSRETAIILRQRLRLYAAAWCGPMQDWAAADLATLLMASPASPRVGFELAGLAPGGLLPAALVPLALNAALLAAEALPRGGLVEVSGDAAGLTILAEGRGACWPPVLVAALAGEPPEPDFAEGPRHLLAPLLAALAAEQGWTLSLALGGPAGLPPLVIGPA